jgi:hypothetical protein
VLPEVALLFLLRAIESSPRPLVMVLAEVFLFVATTAAATWLFERQLLRRWSAICEELLGGKPPPASPPHPSRPRS